MSPSGRRERASPVEDQIAPAQATEPLGSAPPVRARHPHRLTVLRRTTTPAAQRPTSRHEHRHEYVYCHQFLPQRLVPEPGQPMRGHARDRAWANPASHAVTPISAKLLADIERRCSSGKPVSASAPGVGTAWHPRKGKEPASTGEDVGSCGTQHSRSHPPSLGQVFGRVSAAERRTGRTAQPTYRPYGQVKRPAPFGRQPSTNATTFSNRANDRPRDRCNY
jgi:hypothetical protein